MLNNDYRKIEDFLVDDSFVDWTLGNSKELDIYWEAFLTKNPDKIELVQQARNIILAVKIRPVSDLTDSEIDTIVSNFRQRANFNSNPQTLITLKDKSSLIIKYAASIILVAALSLFTYRYTKQVPVKVPVSTARVANAYNTIINETSRPRLIKLPDNSMVILKPLAELKYSSVFSGSYREVFLTGEAFFEVKKDVKKPFIVYSNELAIKVLGTSFTVRAGKSDRKFKVLVSTGKVWVSARSKKHKSSEKSEAVILKPNQQVELDRQEEKLVLSNLERPLLLSKASTKIHFNFINTPFAKVVAKIREAYNVDVVFDEEVMGDCALTAALADQTLDERLKLICKAVEASYTIDDGKVIIKGRSCTSKSN